MRHHLPACAALIALSATLSACSSGSTTTSTSTATTAKATASKSSSKKSTKTSTATSSATSSKKSTKTSSSAAGDGWKYTPKNYDNVTVELKKTPQKIVADAYSMQAMYPYGIRPAGYWGYGQEKVYMKDLDTAKMTNLGKDGEFSLEKLAGLKPDLLIGFGNKTGTGWTWWDEKVTKQATAVAPYLPIDFGGRTGKSTVSGNIELYRDLAKSLGGTTDSDEVTKAKEDYEKNLKELKATLAKRDDLTFALVAPVKDKVWFGQEQMAPVKQLTDAGMKIVGPTAKDKPWEELSWEDMPALKADVILINATTPKEVRAVKLFKKTKAAQADQVFEWDDKRPYTYRNYANWFKKLNDQITAAKDVSK